MVRVFFFFYNKKEKRIGIKGETVIKDSQINSGYNRSSHRKDPFLNKRSIDSKARSLQIELLRLWGLPYTIDHRIGIHYKQWMNSVQGWT